MASCGAFPEARWAFRPTTPHGSKSGKAEIQTPVGRSERPSQHGPRTRGAESAICLPLQLTVRDSSNSHLSCGSLSSARLVSVTLFAARGGAENDAADGGPGERVHERDGVETIG